MSATRNSKLLLDDTNDDVCIPSPEQKQEDLLEYSDNDDKVPPPPSMPTRQVTNPIALDAISSSSYQYTRTLDSTIRQQQTNVRLHHRHDDDSTATIGGSSPCSKSIVIGQQQTTCTPPDIVTSLKHNVAAGNCSKLMSQSYVNRKSQLAELSSVAKIPMHYVPGATLNQVNRNHPEQNRCNGREIDSIGRKRCPSSRGYASSEVHRHKIQRRRDENCHEIIPTPTSSITPSPVEQTLIASTSARSRNKKHSCETSQSNEATRREVNPIGLCIAITNNDDHNDNTKGSNSKKSSFTWNDELYSDFVKAVFSVGIGHCRPGDVLRNMSKKQDSNNNTVNEDCIRRMIELCRSRNQRTKKDWEVTVAAKHFHQSRNNTRTGEAALFDSEHEPRNELNEQALSSSTSAASKRGEFETKLLPVISSSLADPHVAITGTLLEQQAESGAEKSISQMTLIIPTLSEEEMNSSIGSAFAHLIGMYTASQQDLNSKRRSS
jgi:hypothetical protein